MKVLAAIGLLAIAFAVVGAGYLFGGFYSVAANEEDPAIINWALVKVRINSIVRHAQDQPPSGFDDPTKVQDGARVFNELGCTNCHGAPGVKWAKFSEGLRPDPPDLKDVVQEATPSQLFWVMKNGINMTGMPSFAAAGAKDDELWSVVAFLKKLPSISEADYKTWTTPQAAKQ
ncbi:MAG TPA: cytochrome c [Pseudolabrys sp.]|nr:cytochrome c [Pseudolabrys sp.]